jgi:hypothetical protein
MKELDYLWADYDREQDEIRKRIITEELSFIESYLEKRYSSTEAIIQAIKPRIGEYGAYFKIVSTDSTDGDLYRSIREDDFSEGVQAEKLLLLASSEYPLLRACLKDAKEVYLPLILRTNSGRYTLFLNLCPVQ